MQRARGGDLLLHGVRAAAAAVPADHGRVGCLSVAYDSEVAEEKAQVALEQQATQLLGDRSAAEEVADMIERSQQSGGTWWKTTVSVVGVLVGVTGLMGALQAALNSVWEVKPDPDRSALKYLLRNARSRSRWWWASGSCCWSRSLRPA